MEAYYKHLGEPQWRQDSLWSPAAHNLPSDTGIAWIDNVAYAAKSASLHVALLALSLIWTGASLRHSRQGRTATALPKASQISFAYELPSQLARSAALAFTIVAAVRGQSSQWYNVLLLGYAFLLGLTRLANNLQWRHVALHQVNYLIGACLLMLVLGELLPTLVIASTYRPSAMVVGAIVSLVVAILVALWTPREWAPPPVSFHLIQRPADAGPAPEEVCSWWTLYWTFEWLTPLVWKGCRRQVDMDELPALPWYDEPLLLLSRLQEARAANKSTFWTTMKYVRKELTLMTIYSVLAFTLDLLTPFALYQLLAYISDPESAVLDPSLWLILLFIGPIARTVGFQQYVFTSTRLIVRVKSGMTQELYHRAMSSMELEGDVLNDAKGKAITAKKATHAGQLQNLMAGDVDALYQARDIIMGGVTGPLGAIIAFAGLYTILGWPALLGVAILVASIPIPVYVAKLMGSTQRQVKATQDARISLVSEYLSSVVWFLFSNMFAMALGFKTRLPRGVDRAIKYFAWEDAMCGIIERARDSEQKVLWRISVLWMVMSEAVDIMPMVSLVVMFSLYTTVLGQPLTAQVAFTVLSLVSTIRERIAMLGYITRNVTNALISFDRLDRYFNSTRPLVKFPEGPLRIQNATFKRNQKADFMLRDISIDFVEGGLNVIQGASGSGKTTLLLSILGETTKETGDVTRPNDVAFSSQTAWLQNASIKDNILFNSEYEKVRYDRLIEASCLEIDLAELEQGEDTQVGENGTALSGGQKARVALARALYSKAPLLLLDDIFSALDAKTAASVWESCFCSDLLKGRTVVLVTQINWIAQQADLAVVLENGSILSQEQNIGVVRRSVQLSKNEVEEDKGTTDIVNGNKNGNSDVNGTNGTTNSTTNVNDKPAVSSSPKKDVITEEMNATGKTGRLSFLQYMIYFGGVGYTIFSLFSLFLAIASYLAISLWVSYWVDGTESGHGRDIAFYLGIYVAISVGSLVLDAFAFLIFANGGWHAAKKLHTEFVRGVFNVSLDWYKNTPTGRIVNRFSRDMASLDNQLFRLLQGALYQVFQLVLRLGAVSSVMPIFFLPGLISCVVGIIVGEAYTRTAVVVKRLVSSSQSPVFSQFADDMLGIQVIRARKGMPEAFGNLLAERLRSFSRATETNYNLNRWVAMRIDFVATIVTVFAGWLAISQVGIVSAGLVGFSLSAASSLSETILYMVRSMQELEVELQSFHRVREYAFLEPEEEQDKNSSSSLQPKNAATATADADTDNNNDGPDLAPATWVSTDWPRTGTIEFRNVTIRYDPSGPDILKDINLTFHAGERIAVVGRTGSGKSTLVLSLLRFTTVVRGTILYDGVDITCLPRKRLRQALTIIPQEAVLFNGTVGTNLDPSGEVDAALLEKALASCAGIASFQFRDQAISSSTGPDPSSPPAPPPPTEQTPLLPPTVTPADLSAVATSASSLSLSTLVDAKGENFSHGQRQVLSLCRALVRKSKLMLLDEATASMDYETDRGIQAVLRKEMFLPAIGSGNDGETIDQATAAAAGSASNGNSEGSKSDRTLVTIAHRLRTIADYDRVVVMGAGRVIELGTPKELFNAKETFYDMVQHSGEAEELEALFGSIH